jgi:hypothetical protein
MRGVVDENIDSAQVRHSLVDYIAAVGCMLHVTGDKNRFASGGFHELRGLARIVFFIEIGDQDVSAFACVRDSDGTPDAAVAAGDDGALTNKTA